MVVDLAPGDYWIPLTGTAPCKGCGGANGVDLKVGSTGYSAGSHHRHTRKCPTQFCPHGKRWAGLDAEDCAGCEADSLCPHGVPWEGHEECDACVAEPPASNRARE